MGAAVDALDLVSLVAGRVLGGWDGAPALVFAGFACTNFLVGWLCLMTLEEGRQRKSDEDPILGERPYGRRLRFVCFFKMCTKDPPLWKSSPVGFIKKSGRTLLGSEGSEKDYVTMLLPKPQRLPKSPKTIC